MGNGETLFDFELDSAVGHGCAKVLPYRLDATSLAADHQAGVEVVTVTTIRGPLSSITTAPRSASSGQHSASARRMALARGESTTRPILPSWDYALRSYA